MENNKNGVMHIDKDNSICFEKIDKVIKTKKMTLCQWCNYPYNYKKIEKCRGKGCDILICKNCQTIINGHPFCNECTADIVKNNTLILVTKGEVTIDNE